MKHKLVKLGYLSFVAVIVLAMGLMLLSKNEKGMMVAQVAYFVAAATLVIHLVDLRR